MLTGLGSWMNTWTRLTEDEDGQRSKAEAQRYPGSVVLVPCASSLWPAPRCFPHFPVTSLCIPHSSSPLCSEHTRMIVPAGCLSHATLPPDSCSLHLAHTCCLPLRHPSLAPTAPTAFKSPIKHCLAGEGFHYPSCTLPSLPPPLCTFPLCTDVQYDNLPIYIYVSIISTRYGEQVQPIITYVAHVFANKTLSAFLVNEWMNYCSLSQGTRDQHLHILSECLLQALSRAGRPRGTQAG